MLVFCKYKSFSEVFVKVFLLRAVVPHSSDYAGDWNLIEVLKRDIDTLVV